ncbi:sensor histidine kinase [Rhodonellum sp.]|uniref:sensor histidine kinase n=1 Tax=Rhodonellum sp. TaxID=2231180 RepID=UPI002718FACC|nr:sensor histidine kinase [Rhodonellum sp.]MDO9552949.1 histidine kinase [Rhodonellum sp.]
MHTRFFIACLVLVFCVVVQNQAQQFPNRNYTTLDGLPNNAIRSLFIDSRGLLWIGTENGISKMENNTFQNFDTSDGMAFNSCWVIAEDPMGRMWFGSYGGGVSMYDGRFFHTFTSKSGLINDKIRKLFYFEDRIWVGTEDGIAAIDVHSLEIISLEKSVFSGRRSYTSGFFVHDNLLHYTTFGYGIYSISPTGKAEFTIKKVRDHDKIYALGWDSDSLLLSNIGAIQRFAPADLTSSKPMEDGFGVSVVWDYARDNQDNLYAGAWGIFNKDGGLFKITGNKMVDMGKTFGVSSKVILATAYNPQTNMLYAGSNDKGLFAISLNPSIAYAEFDKNSVLGFAGISGKTAVLHTLGLTLLDKEDQVIHQVDLKAFKRIELDYLRKNHKNLPKNVDGFFEMNFDLDAADVEFYGLIHTDSSLYVSSNIGIFELNAAGKFLTYIPVHTFVMGFTPDGRFIESNPYRGLRIYESPAKMDYQYFSDTLPHIPHQLSQIVHSGDKTYFSSVFHGLYTWEKGVFTSYLREKKWSEEKLKVLHLMEDNSLVIASEFGDVFVADDKNGFTIKETIGKNDIEGNSIQFLESYQGNILIGTEKGLTVYRDGKTRFFDEEQGFTSKLFQTAKVIGEVLWLGTSEGYYKVHLPGLLLPVSPPLKLLVDELSINYEPVPAESFSWFVLQQKEIVVPHDRNTVYISFQPSGHQFPGKLSYRYRLKSDAAWSPFSKENKLSLPYLPPGVYPVEVEVQDSHTGVSNIFTLLTIRVKQPFYFEVWFLLPSLILLILIGMKVYKRRIRNMRTQERNIASSSKRLVETKLEALLSQMNPHFIFNAISSIQYFILKNETEKALDYVNKFSRLVRSTLDNSSKLLITLEEETSYLKAYFTIENSRTENRVKLQIDLDPELDPNKINVPPMLLQPFVENAFVHAFTESHQNPSIRINFGLMSENQLFCTIRDNGMGLQAREKFKIHESKGVKLVLERLRLLEGVVAEPLSIQYSPNGTTVEITIPIH